MGICFCRRYVRVPDSRNFIFLCEESSDEYGKVWYSMYKYVLVIVHTSIDKYGKVWYSMYYYENNSNNTR